MIKVSALLSKGRKNAIHQSSLAAAIGVSHMALKAQIRKERMSGIPILSNAQGYWLAENQSEIDEFKATMRKQALSILALLSHLHYTPYDDNLQD